MMDSGCIAKVLSVKTDDNSYYFTLAFIGESQERVTMSYQTSDQKKADYLMTSMLRRIPLKIIFDAGRPMLRRECREGESE